MLGSYRWLIFVALVSSAMTLDMAPPGIRGQADVAPRQARPALRRGARGPAVAELQRRLNAWHARTPGLTVPRLLVDGKFGPTTERVVIAFQRRVGLRGDGVVDETTWDRLPSDPAALAPPSPSATRTPPRAEQRTPTPTRTASVPRRPPATATAAPSARPGAPPAPTPAPGARSVTIMSHRSDTVAGALVIVGELRNDTTSNIGGVVALAQLLDAHGASVGTARGGAAVSVLQPGQRSPFRIVIASPPPSWTRYQMRGEGQATTDQPVRDLLVRVGSAGNVAEGREIVGDVRNDSGGRVRAVELIATLYDARGQVVGMSTAYATYDALGPGQSATFRLLLSSLNGAVRYELQAQAQRMT